MKKSILIVDDDSLVRNSLAELLSQEGYDIVTAESAPLGLEKLESAQTEAALVDVRMPEMDGMEFLSHCHSRFPGTDVIMMTSFGTIEAAVDAVKLGAVNYMTKPIQDEQLKIMLKTLFENRQLREENENLKKELTTRKNRYHNMVGSDGQLQKIYGIIQAIQDTETTVLLRGESGTGKGMIAQAIHYMNPSRKEKPYVEVSCGAIPRDLLESELFGHVKGAFTSAIRDRIGRFEAADGGTILLDEIDALPLYLQVKLLRVLQQKVFERVGDTKTIHVNVRIVAATNRDLQEEIKKGNFREDLYYRLNVITIDVPPLRARKGDIPLLVQHFLATFNEKLGRNIQGVDPDVMCIFLDYDWPGNIRELENIMERACVLTQSSTLTVENFPEHFIRHDNGKSGNGNGSSSSLKEVMNEPEKRVILDVLEQTGWNRKKTAEYLNINRTTLYNKMKKHNLL